MAHTPKVAQFEGRWYEFTGGPTSVAIVQGADAAAIAQAEAMIWEPLTDGDLSDTGTLVFGLGDVIMVEVYY